MNDASPDSSPSRRCILAGGVIVVLVAAVLRFVNLGGPDLWLDEAFAYEASNSLLFDMLQWDVRHHILPNPLPFLEIKVSKRLFGINDAAIRMPSAFWGTMAVLMLYILVGKAANWRTAFFAALVFALSPFAIDWSREARMYGHWLFWSLAMAMLAWDAVRRTEDRRTNALDWRWWLLGFVFMINHAVNVHATLTVGGIGLWIGLVALVRLTRDRWAGLNILGGAALSAGVYLGSWALTGVASILRSMGGGESDNVLTFATFVDHLTRVIIDSVGVVPMPIAVVLWLIALAGIAMLFVQGHWRFALLMIFVGLINWIGYPVFAGRHFFAPRYVLLMAPLLGVGLGVWMMMLWQWRARMAGRAIGVGALLALSLLWLPSWHHIATLPREAVGEALQPMRDHAAQGDMVTFVPDFYFCLADYYHVSDHAAVMLPPMEAREWGSLKKVDPQRPPDPFDADFEAVFAADVAARPPGVWVFMAKPKEMIGRVDRLLMAYDVPTDARSDLDKTASSAHTLSFRVADGRVEHVTSTRGRSTAWLPRLNHMLGRTDTAGDE